MYCGHCGFKMEENSKFCGCCGTKVDVTYLQARTVTADTQEAEVLEQSQEWMATTDTEETEVLEQSQEWMATTDTEETEVLEQSQESVATADTEETEVLDYSQEWMATADTKETEILDDSEQEVTYARQKSTSHQPQKMKVKKKRKFKVFVITLTILGILVGGGIAGFKYLQEMNTPENTIDRFFTLILNEDIEGLEKIVSEDDSVNMSEELQYLLNYYKENRSQLPDDVNALKDNFITGRLTTLPYYVVKKDGKLIDKYLMKLNQRNLTINATFENVKVDLYRDEVLIKEEIKFGEEISALYPGIYEIKIVSLDELTPFSLTETIDLFNSEPNVKLNISNDLNKTEIKSNEPDAVIFIDGKNTGKTASELGTMIGLEDGVEIYGVFKLNGEEIKSNIEKIDGSQKIILQYDYFTPPTISEAKDEAKKLIKGYLRDFAEAVNYDDFSLIEPYMVKNSDLYNVQKDYVTSLYARGIKETYVTHDVLDIFYDEEAMRGTITVKEVYQIQKADNTLNESSYESQYEFKYNEEQEKFLLTKLNLE